ncbi:MAG: hypothetical protein IKK43_02665 [Clostridia bacterium]|nr:hypothetical protein [Clostridia bacterium]
MYIALNSDNERVHISNTKDEEKYFCSICGEEVIKRKGLINAHHFAHKSNSKCIESDGWHYDMSDWHYDWQNQFPIENQEVVFKINDKIHRADVFINNTVIEFQHSPITEEEFNDRNNFYKKLGYKIIWIFDALGKEISHYRGGKNDNIVCSWNYPIRFLNNVDCEDSKVDIFLQINEAIWYRQPNYRNINNFKELIIENNIIKISELNDGLKYFSSDDYYSDFEIIDLFCPFKCRNNEKYSYKKVLNLHRLTDEIYNYALESHYKFYGYCPVRNNEFFDHTECHACKYIDTNCMRCMYRFRNLETNRVSEILDVKYDRDGRVVFLKLCVDGEIKEYHLKELPYYTKTLLEFAEKKNDIKVARFVNVNTGKAVQLTGYDLRMLLKTKKCIGKLCTEFGNASSEKYEIYYWDKPVWLLTWFVEERKTTI